MGNQSYPIPPHRCSGTSIPWGKGTFVALSQVKRQQLQQINWDLHQQYPWHHVDPCGWLKLGKEDRIWYVPVPPIPLPSRLNLPTVLTPPVHQLNRIGAKIFHSHLGSSITASKMDLEISSTEANSYANFIYWCHLAKAGRNGTMSSNPILLWPVESIHISGR